MKKGKMTELSGLRIGPLPDYDWVSYFRENARKKPVIEFTAENYLTIQEKKLIFPSIRMFHAGEASEGKHLLKTAARYARKHQDASWLEAMQWFVAEENRHSYYLQRYMEYYGILPRRKNWLDRMFRRLRKLGGLRGEVIVLVTAEMIALSYYRALAVCTDSQVLGRICRQMLHDELRHLVFQSYTLYKLGGNRVLEEMVRIFLMQMTIWAVWPALGRVLKKGGYSYWTFYRDSMGYLRQSMYIAEHGAVPVRVPGKAGKKAGESGREER